MPEDIQKAETSGGASVVRPITKMDRERGQPRIVTSTRFVNNLRTKELRHTPQRLCTFQTMYETDEAIYTSIRTTNRLTLKALSEGKAVAGPSNSRQSQEAADFINYNLHNMSYGTWKSACNDFLTDIIYGWSFPVIVTETKTYGKYKGMKTLKKLAPRSQQTLYGWVWDKDFREVKGWVQRANVRQSREPRQSDFDGNIPINNITGGVLRTNQYPYIKSEQTLHFRFDPSNNNPEGDSPLVHCYDAHCNKKLLEEQSIIGISKDFSGMVVLRVPSELVRQANDPDTYPEAAREYVKLQEDAAALQNGESAYILLFSDINPEGNQPDYDIQFKGIDGGGKNYEITKYLDHFNKSIYNTFGTGFLLLGQNGSGSYALSGTQKDMHSFHVEENIQWKVDVINNQLIPRLLLANNIFLEWEDMPVFVPKDPDEASLDEVGKFLQRAASVDKLTEEATSYWYEKAGMPTEGVSDLDFTSSGVSQAGRGMGTSGAGADNQQNSETNMENKKLVVDGDYIIDTSTGDPVNKEDLNERGEYK